MIYSYFHLIIPFNICQVFFNIYLPIDNQSSLCYIIIMIETRIVPSTEIPVKTLAEELQVISATNERRFLLYRIAGSNIEDSLSFLHLKIGSYNSWCDKPLFQQLNARRKELEIAHRSEAVKLLRRENQVGAVIIEQRIIEALLKELEGVPVKGDDGTWRIEHEYDLMRTPIAKTVYDKLMQDIDAMPTVKLNVDKRTFVDRMAILLGGVNGNIQTENSQSTQLEESKPDKAIATRHNQVQETDAQEGIIIEGEIIDGQVVGVEVVDTST